MDNRHSNRVLFEEMPILKAVGTLMLPTIIGALVMVVYSLTDTYFVGKLNSSVESAAVALAAPVLLAFNAANNLFGVGGSSMMSRALGRHDGETVRRSAGFALYGSIIFGALISVLCLAFYSPLLTLLGADIETEAATRAYMNWTVILGAVPSIVNVVLSYLVRSEGTSLHAAIGTVFGCVLNMVLDPIFILPWGLNMGAAGAGCATFISNCASCIYFIVLIIVRRSKSFIRLSPRGIKPDATLIKGVFGVGVPAAIQNLLNVIGMTILNNLTAGYGAAAVAGIGIAHKIYMVPLQVALGGAQGVMPLISYNYSSRDSKRFRGAITCTAKLMVPAMLVVGIVFEIFAPQLVSCFIKDAEICSCGTTFLRGFSIAIPFMITDFLAVGVFQAIGSGRTSLIFALLRKLALEIPATIALNAMFGLNGLGFGAAVAEIVMSVLGVIALVRIFNRVEKERSSDEKE